MVVKINLNPTVPPLPRYPDKKRIDVRYLLIPPYATAHIYWNSKLGELVYDLEEPILDEYEKGILDKLENAMLELINVNVAVEKTIEATTDYINKTARLLLDELNIKISSQSYDKIFYYLFRDFIGLNEVDPLLRDYFIEDIECNGVDTPIFIVHRIYRNLRTNVSFNDFDKSASFVEKLAQRTGRYVSYAQPLLDGTLPDGSRVNATYTKDVSSRGPTFCFKDGNIQLSDGRVKNIRELFEESKKNFGSKLENGNEIVGISNLNCCGVKKNLEQKDSKIKSIIKLKAPEKLVKLSFDDGGEIEVTLNHKFHVVDDSLKLIEAHNLKPGMFVPMPKKISAIGYRQKIDVYALLKDFSYLKKICVVSTPTIKEVIGREIQTYSENKNHRQVMTQKYGVGQSYFYEIIHRGNSISFSILDEIYRENGLDFSKLGDISINVYGGGTKEKSKSIKVPREIDENLSYLAGALLSGGHLSLNSIDFSCYEPGFKNSIKEKLLHTFGKYDSYYDDNRIYLCNVFAPYFFNKIFRIPIGNKSRTIEIPEIIFKSDDKIIASFIKGLYDGDGTVSAGLSYKTYSRKLAEELTYLLARLGIFSYLRNVSNEYRVNIPSPYYALYQELVGFDCTTKKEGLKKLVENQTSNKSFIRHGRIPGAAILSIIKKLGIRKTEIVRKCGFNFNRFLYASFSREFARKLVEEIKLHKDCSVVKDELANIESMLNMQQEFIKIKDVKIVENNEPVYDIELEPCTFYIAGNKPMNMFDTIRKFTKIPWTPTQLIAMNTLSPEMLAYFWILLEHKSNILICGGTASGKTTLLNALAFFIPPEARVVSLEETREINLPRENWLPSVARTSIGIGKIGEVDLFEILKSSFRQNPDYLIVGEVRGKEAFVLFQGMASGHSSISTMHAESVDTLVRRLETPPISLSPTLINSLDCVAIATHATAKGQETRKVKEVVEIVNINRDGTALVNTPFKWDPARDMFFFKKQSKVFEKISAKTGIPVSKLEESLITRAKLLYKLYKMKIFGFDEVGRIVNEYYKNPVEVLNNLGI